MAPTVPCPFDNVSGSFSLPGLKKGGKNIPLQVSTSPALFRSGTQTVVPHWEMNNHSEDLWSVNK